MQSLRSFGSGRLYVSDIDDVQRLHGVERLAPGPSAITGKALCPTCRHNIPTEYIMAGKFTTGRRCFHNVASFPTATYCPLYEREPGAD